MADMKKELFAVLLLALIITVSIVNVCYVSRMTEDILELVSLSEQKAFEGDWNSAAENAEEAVRLWEGAKKYTHIFIRHSEIDSTTDEFYSLLMEIYSKDENTTKAAYKALTSRIESIVEMEIPTIGTIF